MAVSVYDASVRHQVYLEGVKLHAAGQFDMFAASIERAVRGALLDIRNERLSDLSRAALQRLIAALSKETTAASRAYHRKLTDMMRELIRLDWVLWSHIYGAPGEEDEADVYPIVWPRIRDSVLPADGSVVGPLMLGIGAVVVVAIEKQIRQAHANGVSNVELMQAMFGGDGTSGTVPRQRAQAATIVGTIIQHANAFLMERVASALFKQYEWVSVLDSRTTEICRHRDGRRYAYADGPRPPAHWNCRSTIVPVLNLFAPPAPDETWFSWIQRQPTRVQDDILGAQQARRLRQGSLKSSDLGGFRATRPLTPKGLSEKLSLITSE